MHKSDDTSWLKKNCLENFCLGFLKHTTKVSWTEYTETLTNITYKPSLKALQNMYENDLTINNSNFCSKTWKQTDERCILHKRSLWQFCNYFLWQMHATRLGLNNNSLSLNHFTWTWWGLFFLQKEHVAELTDMYMHMWWCTNLF